MDLINLPIKTLCYNLALNSAIFITKGMVLSNLITWGIAPLSFPSGIMLMMVYKFLQIKIVGKVNVNPENGENEVNISIKLD